MLKSLLLLPLLTSASNEFGKNFLIRNQEQAGVITLPSGLQYKVLRKGSGTDHPKISAPCECHYEGRTAENYPSGPKFDSSYDRKKPATFAPNQVIKGWTEAMQLMVKGDKWEMFIPSDLAYGDHGRPPKIPGGAVLVFTMEILKIKGPTTPAKSEASSVTPAKSEASSVTPAKSEASTEDKASEAKNTPFKLSCQVANLFEPPLEDSFTLVVHPDWSPLGAQRIRELAEAKFFDGVRFFRVINGFMAQFGIHGDPSVSKQWQNKRIKDDPKKFGIGNKRGRVSFAMAGANTRTTQLFINFVNNAALDGMGFTPVAELSKDDMEVVDRIYVVGEGAPSGPGPNQGSIQAGGNAYLNQKYPKLSYIKSCRLVEDSEPTSAPPAKNFLESAIGDSIASGEPEKASGEPEKTIDLGDGLKLRITQEGDGETFPQAGDQLTMHYTLTLADDDKVIDSSRSRNEPFTFTIGQGQVIRGWDKGVMKMSLGERGMLMVPANLGYGKSGAGADIPPNSDLLFDVEVLAIGDKRSAAFPETSVSMSSLLVAVSVALGCLLLIFRSMSDGQTCPPADKSTRRAIEMTVGKSAPE